MFRCNYLFGHYLPPSPLLLVIDGSGNFSPAGVEHSTYRKACFGKFMGSRFQGADTDYGHAQAEGQPLGSADSHPQSVKAARSAANNDAVQRPESNASLLQQSCHAGHQLHRVVLPTAPGKFSHYHAVLDECQAGVTA